MSSLDLRDSVNSDVVLVNPKIGIYTHVFRPFLPLALLSVASTVEQAGYSVQIIDQHVDRDWETTLGNALRKKPICVGVTSMTGSQLKSAIRTAQIVRRFGSTPLVWGGVHASLFPAQTLQSGYADWVMRGEGEHTFPVLLRLLQGEGKPESVPGLSWLEHKTFRETKGNPFLELDELPLLPYHLVEIPDYLHTYFYEKKVIEIETSRGCPFNCGFCYNKAYNQCTWRAKSPKRVVEEIRHLAEGFGVRNILAIDDSFFVDRKRVVGIADEIIRHKLGIKMGFQGRVRGVLQMDDAELDRLIEAGCVFLQFGVESGSPRILKMINKQLDVNQVLELNRRLRRYRNLYMFYNFIVGFPTETRKDMLQTVRLAWRLMEENPNTRIGTIHIYKEYPQTPLFKLSQTDGYLPPTSLQEWAEYDWQSAVQRDKSPELMRLIKAISVVSYCLDDKIEMLGDSKVASIVSRLYRPIARTRFRREWFRFMPEKLLF